jgi:hypothetical protein
MRRIRWMLDETVFHWIEMRAVHVSRKVAIVAYRVLAIWTLTNSPVAAVCHHPRLWLAGSQILRKRGFDCVPPTGVVGIARRQGLQTMHMIGKNGPGVYTVGCAGAHPANHEAQYVDLRPIATIIRHAVYTRAFGKAECALLFRPTLLLNVARFRSAGDAGAQ